MQHYHPLLHLALPHPLQLLPHLVIRVSYGWLDSGYWCQKASTKGVTIPLRNQLEGDRKKDGDSLVVLSVPFSAIVLYVV